MHVRTLKPQGGWQAVLSAHGGPSLEWCGGLVPAYAAVLTQEGACCMQCSLLQTSSKGRCCVRKRLLIHTLWTGCS